MRGVIALLCLGLSGPALAEEGVFVWNDPEAMAILMIRIGSADPATATAIYTLQELSTLSATMTAVSGNGEAVGLCRQERDDIEAPAWLSGFDQTGKQLWKTSAGDYHAALTAAMPKGVVIDRPADWFTFSCKDAGIGGSEVLAFDVGFSAGKPGADGYVDSETAQEMIVRIHVAGKTGEVLDTDLVTDGQSALRRTMPSKQQIYVDVAHSVVYAIADGPGVVLPDGGRGQVFWNNRPFRWQGKPVVKGYDFAWYLPVVVPR